MIKKNDLRVWGVWDSVISRLEYLFQSQNDCRHIIDLYRKAHREGLQLLRFDLSPLYYDGDVGLSRSCSFLPVALPGKVQKKQ